MEQTQKVRRCLRLREHSTILPRYWLWSVRAQCEHDRHVISYRWPLKIVAIRLDILHHLRTISRTPHCNLYPRTDSGIGQQDSSRTVGPNPKPCPEQMRSRPSLTSTLTYRIPNRGSHGFIRLAGWKSCTYVVRGQRTSAYNTWRALLGTDQSEQEFQA